MSDPLALRAVACEGWRPLEGMLFADATTGGHLRYMWGTEHGYDSHWLLHFGRECLVEYTDMDGLLPVFADPATRGCLLALVREALDEAAAHVGTHDNGMGWTWTVWHEGASDHDDDIAESTESEAAALVAALKAEP